MTEQKAVFNLPVTEAALKPLIFMKDETGLYFIFKSDMAAIAQTLP